MRTEEHVNDNHIEWPPIHYLLSLKEAKKNENTFLRDIFIATHFFVKLQQVTQKDLIQHFKVAVQWAF